MRLRDLSFLFLGERANYHVILLYEESTGVCSHTGCSQFTNYETAVNMYGDALVEKVEWPVIAGIQCARISLL